MTTRTHSSRKGFTLIELLTVIAIIGILASILIPTIGNVITTAKKAAAQNNASQIAKTYIAYSNSGSNTRTIRTTEMAGGGGSANEGVANTIEDVAFILAKFTQLNDASLWFIKADDNLTGVTIPKVVIIGNMQDANAPSPDFNNAKPKSWAFAIGLSTSAQSTSTPLLWTYGLGHNGIWANSSPWKGSGGHIAYLDGHVEWADKLTTDASGISFTGYATSAKAGQPTVDYTDAVNSKAKVLNSDGGQGAATTGK